MPYTVLSATPLNMRYLKIGRSSMRFKVLPSFYGFLLLSCFVIEKVKGEVEDPCTDIDRNGNTGSAVCEKMNSVCKVDSSTRYGKTYKCSPCGIHETADNNRCVGKVGCRSKFTPLYSCLMSLTVILAVIFFFTG